MYSVFFNDTPVGQARVKREGLYYKILCRCVFPHKNIYRIKVTDGNKEVDLGICVPEGNYFTLISRIAVKNIPGDNLQFTVTTNQTTEYFVADRKPFHDLDKLETARLQNRNGQLYVVID